MHEIKILLYKPEPFVISTGLTFKTYSQALEMCDNLENYNAAQSSAIEFWINSKEDTPFD